MTWVAVAVAGSSLIGGLASADAQRSAGNKAADAQGAAAQAGISQQQQQFDAVQRLLAPYVAAGTGGGGQFDTAAYLRSNPDVAGDPFWSKNPYGHFLQYGQGEGRVGPVTPSSGRGSLGAQQDLLGLGAPGAQQAAIDAIRNSPQFTSLQQVGNENILANASATGNLRGGNVQAALGQFSPQLLNQLIDQQYSRLGGLTGLSQNAAAGVGNAGVATGSGIAALLQQQGAAQAGGALAGGRADAGMWNSLSGAIGQFAGLGGFRRFPGGDYSGMATPDYAGANGGFGWKNGTGGF